MLFRVDFKSGQAIHLQLAEQIKTAAAAGVLRPGEALPTMAAVAGELRISRNTIAKAYAEVERLGIIELVPGRGHCVKEQHRALRTAISRTAAPAADTTPPRPRRRISSAAVSLLLATSAFLLAGLLVAALVRAGLVRGEAAAVAVTLLLLAALLPLRRPVEQRVERMLFRKRHRLPGALAGLRAQLLAEPELEAALQRVVESSAGVIGIRPELVRDRGELAALVSSFPALRWTRAPIPSGNDLLMPLFSQEELLGVLRLAGRRTAQPWDPEDWEFLTEAGALVAQLADQLRQRGEKVEAEYALDIQRGLLPREVPQVAGFSIAGAWQPSKSVGGDYYDVFPLGERRLALLVADVSGKGVPAALLMASLQASTRAHAGLTSSPRELCARVNRALCASISPGKFVTFFYAVLDAQQRTLVYCNAGHNPPLVIGGDGRTRTLESGGAILGVFPEAAYEEESVHLLPGDRLLIFTDGVVEASDAAGHEFGNEGVLAAAAAAASAGELRDAVMQSVTRFCSGDFADDATLLTIVAEAQQAAAAGR